jgi:hypothetical protein
LQTKGNPARVRTDQCFSTSNETDGESGNVGGNFESIFADLLRDEYGFSAADVVKILAALERVAMEFAD